MRIVWNTAAVIAVGLTFAVTGARRAEAQSGFEGTMTFQVHADQGAPKTVVASTKGNKLRLEVDGGASPMGPIVILADGSTHTRTIVMSAQKRYMTLPAGAGDPTHMAAPDQGAVPKFTFAKTGRTETVAGENCDDFHVTTVRDGKTEEGEMCVGKGVGLNTEAWQSLAGGNSTAMNAQMSAIRDAIGAGNGVLKVTSIKNGQPVVAIEVTKIERKSLSDDIFSPPAGYTQMQMPQMPQMRQGAGGGQPTPQ
jgi:hypothetical protein